MLTDRFGRQVDYLRLSVTDRCDFRCVYCMAEQMTFLPRERVLTLEELHRLARAFIQLGVRRIRLTGGEPLVRRDLPQLAHWIASEPGLAELTLTTNGSRLGRYAASLRDAGVKRLNISLDSLDPARFHALTRTGELADVLAGIQAAKAAGFARIRLNSVILRGRNEDEIPALADFALAHGLDLAFIEEMPLGEISEHSRALAFMPSEDIRAALEAHVPLMPATDVSAGAGALLARAGVSQPDRFYLAAFTQLLPPVQSRAGNGGRAVAVVPGQ